MASMTVYSAQILLWHTKTKLKIACPKLYSIFLHYSKDRKFHHPLYEEKAGAAPQGLVFFPTRQPCWQPALVFPKGIQLLPHPAKELQRHSPTAPPAQRWEPTTCSGPYRNFSAVCAPPLDFNTKARKQILTAVYNCG